MLRILNIDPDNYSSIATEILCKVGHVTSKPMTRSELRENLPKFDVLVMRFAHKIDDYILENASSLKVIATNVTGTDHIDSELCKQKNIEILSLKGEYDFLDNIHATAEHTWGLLLNLVRNVHASVQSVQQNEWDRDNFVGNELHSKRIGILGFGRIGRKIANYAKAFGMHISVHDIRQLEISDKDIQVVSFETLMKTSDVLSIHVPLNLDTIDLINEEVIRVINPNCVIVNTSRGRIVTEGAVLKALMSGELAGYATDVLAYEKDDELIKSSKLIEYSRLNGNLLITPHIGGATWESWSKTEIFIAQKLSAFLTKER